MLLSNYIGFLFNLKDISVSIVLRILDTLSTFKVKLPEIISIDEFKGNAGNEKFQFIINDPINKKLIIILYIPL